MLRTTHRPRPWPLAALLAVALMSAAAACSSSGGSATVTSGGTGTTAPLATGTTATSGSTSSATTAAPTTGGSATPTPLWQPAGQAPATAQAAALTFAAQYLGLANPKVAAADAASKPLAPPTSSIAGATVVRVQPNGAGPATSISVVKGADGWQVVRADADTIVLKTLSTASGKDGTTTIVLGGTSQTFEGLVVAQVRPLAWVPGTTEPLVSNNALGGASSGPGGFMVTPIVPAGAKSPVVVVLGEPDASGHGQLLEATAVAVALPH